MAIQAVAKDNNGSYIELKDSFGSFKVYGAADKIVAQLESADNFERYANIVRTILLVGCVIGCVLFAGSGIAHQMSSSLGIPGMASANAAISGGLGCGLSAIGLGFAIHARSEKRDTLQKAIKELKKENSNHMEQLKNQEKA